MTRPFDAWSARARQLARPLAENPYRLLELEPGASAADLARAVKRLQAGREPARMLATGSPQRTVEQVRHAAAELADPLRAGQHSLFVPWLRRLSVDADALPAALDALSTRLRQAVTPQGLAATLAGQILPGRSEDAQSRERSLEVAGGRFFASDLSLPDLLGPPQRKAPSRDVEGGLLATLGKAPGALANAVLAASRLGQGRRLHARYLHTLLAQADGGDASAWRRLSEAEALFEEVSGEPDAPLLRAHRDFLLGQVAAAKRQLTRTVKDPQLDGLSRTRAEVLLARIGQDEKRLAGREGPEAAAARASFLLSRGELEQAAVALDEAWSREEARPRLAPLHALVLLATDDLEGAARTLALFPQGETPLARFAAAWLAHAQGDFAQALGLYDEVLAMAPQHLGAQWGRAVLADDPKARASARAALAKAAPRDASLAAGLLELALADGALEEISAGLERINAGDHAVLRVQALDRLGRRAEAWRLREADESAVRDAARALLNQDDALGALRELAGLSLADPLRRRAARMAVLDALAVEPDADPDHVVERVLGRVSPEELALLDLPAHLYRAVRELREGHPKQAVGSLRRHLDSGDDPKAARLFDVLTAPAGQGFPALEALLGQLLEVDGRDLQALVDAAIDADDAVFEAAVIVAALQGGAFEVGELEDATPELLLAIALLELRHGLLTADWSLCADAIATARRAQPRPQPELERASDAIAMARFPEAILADPEGALQALQVAQDDPAARLHDLAVWRHFTAIEAEGELSPAALQDLVGAWAAAWDAKALAHPATPAEQKTLEDELLTALAQILSTVAPDRAETARDLLLELDHPLAQQLLARAGWTAPSPRRRRSTP